MHGIFLLRLLSVVYLYNLTPILFLMINKQTARAFSLSLHTHTRVHTHNAFFIENG